MEEAEEARLLQECSQRHLVPTVGEPLITRTSTRQVRVKRLPAAHEPQQRTYTSGGGSQNPSWIAMRQRLLGVPTARANNIDAAYGAALLAARGA